MNPLPDPLRVAALVREVAATEILPRFGHLTPGQIQEKAPGQLVTEADLAAERALIRGLAALAPGVPCVGEEGVAANPALLRVLEQPGPAWVIDPVDGTANFARGSVRFAVILALVIDGETRQGWIFDPVADRMMMAEQGSGAWEEGHRLVVPPGGPLPTLSGSIRHGSRLHHQVACTLRQGSAAHDYLDLARGTLHFAHFRGLMPWDHAAGVLIHAEAGGYGRMIDSTPYCPQASKRTLLLAPDAVCWEALRAAL